MIGEGIRWGFDGGGRVLESSGSAELTGTGRGGFEGERNEGGG